MNNVSATEKAKNNGGYKIAVNSIQRTLHVERLCINPLFVFDTFLPYDKDNLYPNKIKAIAQRSGTTSSAIETLSSFISGEGFAGMDQVVNRDKQKMWDILRHVSYSKANFKGFALHFNYNLLGQITEITPVNFEFVRLYRDLKKYVTNPDWSRRTMFKKDEVVYNPFNPGSVIEEIMAAGGIDKYKGQLLYWIPNSHDYYTPCNWDAVLDDAQFEAEAKLYSLSSIQNDYALGGYLVYPKNLTDEGEIQDVKNDLAGDKGSGNAGGTRVFSVLPSENLQTWKYFIPVSRNNIDGLHTNQIERAKFNIYACFRQPPILNGVATGGMFNQESFLDAFTYYNSQTETERKEAEKILTWILSYSIWSGIGSVQIIPKTFAGRTTATNTPAEPQAAATTELNSTLTNLTGRQLQGVFRITRKYKKGELTYDQAAQMLKQGFGISDEDMQIWLINDEQDG
jgi:hypothetical protein